MQKPKQIKVAGSSGRTLMLQPEARLQRQYGRAGAQRRNVPHAYRQTAPITEPGAASAVRLHYHVDVGA